MWLSILHQTTTDSKYALRRHLFTIPALLLLACIGVAGNVHPGLLKEQRLTIDGSARSYDIYVPTTRANKAYPLVFLLHGHRGNANMMMGEIGRPAPYRVWLDIAERERLLLVIPDGENGADGYRGWNDCRADVTTNPHTDDVGFIDQLIEAVATAYPIDRSRLYATGTSNGGMMVYRLALERAEAFAAVAPVVAAMPARSQCGMPVATIPILIMNGSTDPFVPWQGGAVGRDIKDRTQRGTVLSTANTVKFWVNQNAATAAPVNRDLPDIDTNDHSTVHVSHYAGVGDSSEVVLYEVRGGGHTEPSLIERYGILYRRILGPQNGDIEMAEEVWRFFSRHHREPPQ